MEAGKTGKLNTYIIFPSGVHGRSLGPTPGTALGVVQLLYKFQAQQLGFVPYVGDGSALFQNIHVEDFAPFVLDVLEEALKTDTPKDSVYERCYITSSKATPWKEVSAAYAKLLHAQGIVSSSEAKSVRLEEAGEGELPKLQGGSMLLKNERARRLGFKPTKEDVVEFLEKEAEKLS